MADIYDDIKNGPLTLEHDWGNIENGRYAASGKQVQDLIKSELKSRVGYFYSFSKNNIVNVLIGFMNEDKYKEWFDLYKDPQTDVLNPEDIDEALKSELVICHTEVSKGIPDPFYSSKLENKYSSERYISVDGKILIPMRFTSTYNEFDPGTGELMVSNNSEQGDLIVQARESNDISWDSNSITKGTYKIQSTHYNDTEGFEVVDLTDLLRNGNWEVRVMARSSVGTKAESVWVYYSVIKTNINVSLMTNWQVAQSTGKISLNFRYEGAFVDKYLNLEVSGVGSMTNGNEKKTVVRQIGTDSQGTISITIDNQQGDTYRVDAHGIHTIKYWVDVERNENYQTQPNYVQIMVATDKNNLSPYIIMNGLKGDTAENALSNWTNQDIVKYSVYAPNELGDLYTEFPVKISFKDTNDKEYFNDVYVINSKEGEIRTINTDLSIESDSDVIAPRMYCYSNWDNVTEENQSNLLVTKSYIQLYINNKGDFAPSAGADFIFNPRTRSNTESPEEIVKIYNGATGKPIGDSSDELLDDSEKVKWSGVCFNNTDGWLQDNNGRKCLRLLDGQQLTIPYQPFSRKINGVEDNSVSCYTVEFSIATRNIVNPEVPLIRICDNYRATEDSTVDTINGFELRGTDAYFMLNLQKIKESLDKSDIMFREGEKTHIAINISYPEKQKDQIVSGTIKPSPTHDLVSAKLERDYSFIKIYVNGVLNRVIDNSNYVNVSDETQSFGSGTGQLKRYIILGNEGVYDEYGQRIPGGDLDVYEIRAYKGSLAKEENDILKDYMASLSTVEEKEALMTANDIIDETTGTVSYAKASLKYNTMLLRPSKNGLSKDNFVRPCGREFGDTKKTSNVYNVGDLEIRLLKEVNGKMVLDEDKSGVINDVFAEGQGTSAMTYYKWNQRHKLGETSATTYFTPIAKYEALQDLETKYKSDKSSLEKSYEDQIKANPDNEAELTAELNSKLDELTTKYNDDVTAAKNTPGASIVKKGYYLNDDDPVIARLDGKINWASSMHSHKMGATSLYNDCWRQIVGSGLTKLTSAAAFDSLDLGKMKSKMKFKETNEAGETVEVERTPTSQEAFENACKFTGRSNGYGSSRVCVRQEPFLFFVQSEYKKDADDNPTNVLVDPVYYGTLTWGASKGDKPTFGYNKEFNPYFVMIEGADNDEKLVMCSVPWDTTHVTQGFEAENEGDPEEDWVVDDPCKYNGSKQFEISMGKDTQKYIGKGWDGSNPCLKMFKDMINYAYLHNHRINVFKGTYEQLTKDTTVDKSAFYWVTEASGTTPPMNPVKNTRSDKYDLYRYNSNDVDGDTGWVNAGLYDAETNTYAKLNLQEQLQVTTSELATGNPEENNQKFINVRVSRFRNGYKDLKTHPYNYHEEYPNGISEYVHVADLEFTLQFLKLIAATDNWGKNTYIYNTGIYYKKGADGKYLGGSEKYNGLDKFGFFQDDVDTIFEIDNSGQKTKPYYVEEHDIEKATGTTIDYYWNSQTNALYCLAEQSYAAEMRTMMSRILDTMNALGGSPVNCFDKYFQKKAQEYLPATIYNKNSELLYIDGYYRGSIDGFSAPTVDLFLSQCLGDQCQAEREWQKKRVDYISSYASWGNFAPGTGGGGGIIMRSQGYPYVFDLTPHIWLYPVVTQGSSDFFYEKGDANPTGTLRRVAAGETVRISLGATGETQVSLKALDMYSDIGNFAENTPNADFTLKGSRLTQFIVRGTVDKPILFNPSNSFKIDEVAAVDNIRHFEISGPVTNNASIMNYEINLNRLWRLETVDLTATSTTGVILPNNSNIRSIKLPNTVRNLSLVGLSKLTEFNLGGYNNLKSLEISNTPIIDSLNFIKKCITSKAQISSLTLIDIDWKEVDIETLSYILNVRNTNITGKIKMMETEDINFDLKCKLLEKFGNIDSESNDLYVEYTTIYIGVAQVVGDTYLSKTGKYQYKISVPSGNDVTSINWSISVNSFATINNSGEVTFRDDASITDQSQRVATVTCQIYTSNGEVLSKTKTIYFFEKVAEIGDFVYYDGSLSTAAEYNPDKTVIGVCYYVNGNDRRMMATGLASPDAIMWGMSSLAFYKDTPLNGGQDVKLYQITIPGDSDNKNGANAGYTAGLSGTSSHTPDLNNISSLATPENRSTKQNLTTYAYSDKGINANFVKIPKDTSLPCGQYNTINIIEHRNQVVIPHESGIGCANMPGCDRSGNYLNNEKSDLTSLIDSFKNQTIHLSKEASLYPAASYCYAYEPEVKVGETLDARFKIHNWYLPSISELAYMWLVECVDSISGGKGLNACKVLKESGKWQDAYVGAWGPNTGPYYWSSNVSKAGLSEVQVYLSRFSLTQFRTISTVDPVYGYLGGASNGSITINRHNVRACAKF